MFIERIRRQRTEVDGIKQAAIMAYRLLQD